MKKDKIDTKNQTILGMGRGYSCTRSEKTLVGTEIKLEKVTESSTSFYIENPSTNQSRQKSRKCIRNLTWLKCSQGQIDK